MPCVGSRRRRAPSRRLARRASPRAPSQASSRIHSSKRKARSFGSSTNQVCSVRGRLTRCCIGLATQALRGSSSSAISASITRLKRDGRSIRCSRRGCASPGSTPFAVSATPSSAKRSLTRPRERSARRSRFWNGCGRIQEFGDTARRYASIAAEYVAAHEARERVLVVSPANDERRQLNAVIRQALKERGLVGFGEVTQTVLVNRDLTRPQRGQSRSYEVGDIVRFTRGSRRMAMRRKLMPASSWLTAKMTGLSIRAGDGRLIGYSPKRLSGVEVFREEGRTFAAGDRIQFRAPERTLKLANGEFATIVSIDERTARIRTQDGREIDATVERLRHIDYGYASTSHSSQGATVDRVIVNIDTMRSAELVNRKQFYVSISRARHGISVYTDDKERLRQVVNRSREKSTALEQISVNLSHSFKVIPDRTLLAQSRSYGIRR